MKARSGIILLVFFSVLVISCQREVDETLPQSGQQGETLLERLVLLDTTLPAPLDTIYYGKFLYDAQKRINKIFWITISAPDRDTVFQTAYYNGNDTLPYKWVTSGADGSTEDFIFYDVSGKVVADSMRVTDIMGTSVEVQRYSYLTGYLKKEVKFTDILGAVTIRTDTIYQVRSGNNILQQRDTSTSFIPGDIYVVALNYQYDNRPNPLKRVFRKYIPYYVGEEMLEDNLSDHNFLDISTERKTLNPLTIIDVDHYTYTYVYGTNGLPKIAWERDVNNGTVDKYLYFYAQ
jgi:hypothetical protein